ncbi:haloacid dehalogenase-like hydrolase [Termitidicoccus mucosus]|uniref:Haloacid dehalogenase n=1 Tax=Termitidicoccus mucosus TaxID=1184151 RepID=A0A178IDI8_9BACT|nr:haloacid dehalogenase [Opitutaceae bacterium TSB47]
MSLRPSILIVFTAIPLLFAAPAAKPAPCRATAPLASWNDGTAKKALVDYVAKVTTKGSPDYVPPAERIAVFDNDGTLWTEQPLYFQIAFAFHQVGVLAPRHPEWQTTEPYASILRGDIKAALDGGESIINEIVTVTHTGMTTGEFAAHVQAWLDTARHPRFNRPYTECVYQPMLEVLRYLRDHGFKTFIVSGGTADFIRVFAERVYGIPPEQVIGATFATRYEPRPGGNGGPAIVITPRLGHDNDKAGKPVGIHAQIGRPPLLAFGNSDGDYQMLEYTTGTPGRPRLGFIVRHTDADREYAYDRGSPIGALDKALDHAASKNWILIDMKTDWKTVHPEP